LAGLSAQKLDLLGARAWPPLEERRIGGWRLRFSGGVTRRANSVLPLGGLELSTLAGADLAKRIDHVEAFYRERGLPPRFQLTASSMPTHLRGVLTDLGYYDEDTTLVLTGPANRIQQVNAPDGAIVKIADAPSRAWLETWWSVDGRGGEDEFATAHRLLSQIKRRCLFAELRDGTGTAAVALGVVDGSWLGLYCLATVPHARRQGYGHAVTRRTIELAKKEFKVRHLHTAVLEANVASQHLCAQLGLRAAQSYRYLTH
jgi:N-acetylglutamate synthase